MINLFGKLEILSVRGSMEKDDLKSPKGCRLFAYMALNRNRSITTLEMGEKIWEDDESDNLAANVRSVLYRLGRATTFLWDEELIIKTTGGYRINAQLNVIVDVEQFDEYCKSADMAVDDIEKNCNSTRLCWFVKHMLHHTLKSL